MDDSNNNKTGDDVEIVSDVKQPSDVTPDPTSRPLIQNQDVQSDPMVTTSSGPVSDVDTSSEPDSTNSPSDTASPTPMDTQSSEGTSGTSSSTPPVNGGEVPSAVANELASNSISSEPTIQPTPSAPTPTTSQSETPASPIPTPENTPQTPVDTPKPSTAKKSPMKLALIVVGVLIIIVIVAVVVVHK